MLPRFLELGILHFALIHLPWLSLRRQLFCPAHRHNPPIPHTTHHTPQPTKSSSLTLNHWSLLVAMASTLISTVQKYALPIGVGLVATAIAAKRCVAVVPAGHVGIQDTFGKVNSATLAPGLHCTCACCSGQPALAIVCADQVLLCVAVKNPMTTVHPMSIMTQMLPVQAHVPTSEGLTVDLDAAVLFKLDPTR